MGVGLLVEEHRAEIRDAWLGAVDAELGGERALEFAVVTLLRELSLALRVDAPRLAADRPNPHARCAVLIRSSAPPARVAREFKLLRRAVWAALRRAGQVISPEDRREADEWLDDALAAALDRAERVRLRIDLLERGPQVIPPAPPPQQQRPPPLPWQRAARPRQEPPVKLIE